MSKPPKLSSADLHQRILHASGLYNEYASVDAVLNYLGYVQIDAIARVVRAHHHIIWSRYPAYRQSDLNTLLTTQQAFEYWGHAASYLPMEDYPHYLHNMESFMTRSPWAGRQYAAHKKILPEIYARIEKEGPLSAKDFEGKRTRQGWGGWKPAKIALELLYWQGELMVAKREKGQKFYDVTKRCLPSKWWAKRAKKSAWPTAYETARHCLNRAFQVHGVLTFAEAKKYLPLVTHQKQKEAWQDLIREGLIVPAQYKAQEIYFHTRLTDTLPENLEPKTHILSPFDPLIIQRSRLIDYFDYKYIFEAYVTAAKRQYGYFVLPVLQGEHFIGRIELKAHRKESYLEMINWWPEKSFDKKSLHQALERFGEINGCEHVDALTK